MEKHERLTCDHDKELLCLILNFKERHGYSPTYRELQHLIGLSSTSSTKHRVNRLFEAGWLTKPDHRIARGMDLTKDGYNVIRSVQDGI